MAGVRGFQEFVLSDPEKQVSPLRLAGALVSGLVLATPLIHFFSNIPPIALVAVIGAIYCAIAIKYKSVERASVTAVLVLGTFAAEVPITSSQYYGQITPSINLYHLALISTLPLFMIKRWRNAIQITRTQLLLAGVIVWSLISILFGNPQHVGPALSTTVLLFSVWIGLTVVSTAVSAKTLSLRDVLGVCFIVIGGHVFYALSEFVSQSSFGMTQLGDNVGEMTTIDYFFVGSVEIGPYISGLTGFSYSLNNLILLILPLCVLLIWKGDDWIRRGAAICASVGYFVIMATVSQAALTAIPLIIFLPILFILSLEMLPIEKIYLNICSQKSTRQLLLSSVVVSPILFVLVVAKLEPVISIGGESLSLRIQQYILAIEIAIDNPIFGIGFGNFYYATAEMFTPQKYPIHNIYLAVLASIGFPGYLLFMGALVSLIESSSVYAMQLQENECLRISVVGIICGLLIVMYNQLWTHLGIYYYVPTVTFWMLGGAVLGQCNRDY